MAKRKYYRKTYQKSKNRKGIIFILKNLILCFLFFVAFAVFLFLYYAKDLPRPEKFTEKQIIQSTKIYDRSGKILLYDIYGEEKREIVSLEKIPEYLKEAVIVAEDASFYHHFGIDLKAVGRAILVNLKLRKPIQGGSTISQQLIRSSFLTIEKTLERKIREVILTLELERRYSKDQILEWYLNQVPFGQNSYGVEAASRTYFGKSVSQISLAEATTLTSLIKAPSYLSPYGEEKETLLTRKNYILDRLASQNYITKEEAKKAKEEEIKFAKVLNPIKAPHFVMYVKKYLEEKYGENFLKEEGFKVYTSLDWEFQELAEKVVKEGSKINEKYQAFNTSLVAINPKTGEILAMVGSKDYFGDPYPEGCIPGKNCFFEPQPNVSLLGRQPGSAFKPFVYATALKKGYDDKYTVIDEKTNFGIWGTEEYIPQNYDGKFRGEVTIRESLAQSLNVPSVKVLLNLADSTETFKSGKEPDSVKTAKDLGITTLKPPYGPSIVLGGWEVKLLEMVSAYGVFATEGFKNPPVTILKIEDKNGDVIEENKTFPKRVLETEVARLINDILSDNQARAPIFGSRSIMYFEDFAVAAKTGTTENYRDGWIIGYTPSIVVGVWAGNNDNTPMKKEPGMVIAGPIWKAFIERVILKYPKENFSKPSSLE